MGSPPPPQPSLCFQSWDFWEGCQLRNCFCWPVLWFPDGLDSVSCQSICLLDGQSASVKDNGTHCAISWTPTSQALKMGCPGESTSFLASRFYIRKEWDKRGRMKAKERPPQKWQLILNSLNWGKRLKLSSFSSPTSTLVQIYTYRWAGIQITQGYSFKRAY